MVAVPLRIDLGSPDFLERLHELGSLDVLKCYQCGTCVGDCPAVASDLHVRRLMKYTIYGLEGPLMGDQSVWGCTTCHQCSERCPEGASPYELIMAIRRYQSRDGRMPEALRAIARNILRTGHSVDLEDKHRKARVAVGLPEVPPTILRHPEAISELQAIWDSGGFKDALSEGGEG